jgi:ATP-dependent protease ClpP protease subunit
MRDRLNEILARHTGQTMEKDRAGHRARQLHERRGGGGYGLVDQVLSSREIGEQAG